MFIKTIVSIPSNRGSHSNEAIDYIIDYCEDSLNPLESGQSFEYAIWIPIFLIGSWVSIPSNRGSHSNLLNTYTTEEFDSVGLNPLESGQSFECRFRTAKTLIG